MTSHLLRALLLIVACVSAAHAQQPGLFESLGKMLKPTAEAKSAGATPAPAAANANRTLAIKPATPGRRIALVIGNADYRHPESLPRLANPTNDAQDIAEALRNFGFDVIERRDQTLEGMSQAVAEFGSKIGGSEAALFYFAGHGIQVKNQNYLMPVSAKIESEASVPFQGFNVNQVLEEMDNGKSGANIVMLDACRNNPISGKFRSGASRGLASPGNTPQGTVIVYATDPGNTAADGEGRNGLFSAGLLAAFKGKDMSLDGVLTAASEYVEQKSLESDPTHKQTPYVNGPKTLQKNFHFKPGDGTQLAQLSPGTGGGRTPTQIDDALWDSIKGSSKPGVFEAYLREYPNGRHRSEARVKLADLTEAAKPAPTLVAVLPTPTSVAPAKADDPDTAMWNEVKNSGAREYLDAYLKQYPKGKYVALAKLELKKFDDKAKNAARNEQDAWTQAKAGDTAEAYAGYLQSYPKGRYAALAQAAQAKLQQEAAEKEKQLAAQRKQDEERQTLAAERKRLEAEKAVRETRPGMTFKDCAECPEMVVIPAGSFTMGSPASETGRFDNEGPQHGVIIAQPFLLGKTHVTRGQFVAFVNSTGYNAGDECYAAEGGKFEKRSAMNWKNPGYKQDDSHPVVCVSWDDAKAYVGWLSRKTGKSYRLPSEAEWEYAARAGTTEARYWGESPDQACAYANVMDSTGKAQMHGVTWEVHNCTDGYAYTAPVGRFRPNAFGLYDMIGNAWQWNEDCWHKNYAGAPTDGSVFAGGECTVGRLLRGNSWNDTPRNSRSANRFRVISAARIVFIGFRVARTLY